MSFDLLHRFAGSIRDSLVDSNDPVFGVLEPDPRRQQVEQHAEFGGARRHIVFDPRIHTLQRCAPGGDPGHFPHTLPDGDAEKDILEEHPARVFEPAPGTDREHAEDRLRPEDAPCEMIRRHHHGRGGEDTPVAIEGEKGKRTEDVKVSLDAPPSEMDEQRGGEHLPDRNDVACSHPARACPREKNGQGRNHSAQKNRRPHVQVRLALRADPGPR